MRSAKAIGTITVYSFLLILLIGVYTTVFLAASYCQYNSFSFQDMDLAIINQAFWNGIHGELFTAGRVGESTIFNDHRWFIALPLLPLYAIFPGPLILLFFQSAALSLGAWGVYLLARKILSPQLSTLFSFCYLINPSINYITLYEFHPLTFAVPLLLFTFYFYERRRWGWYLVFLVLSLSCREDVALPVFGIGVYAMIRGLSDRNASFLSRWKWSISAMVLSLAWFALCAEGVPALMASLHPDAEHTSLIPVYFNWLGRTPGEIIGTIFTRPGYFFRGVFTLPKIFYLFQLLAPLGFLSLLSPVACVMIVFGALDGLLSARGQHFSIQYQYTAMVIPFVFIAAIHGAEKLMRGGRFKVKPDYLIFFLLIVSPLSAKIMGPLFNLPGMFRAWQITEEDGVRERLIRMVPPQAPVLATFELAPHLSNRSYLFYSFQFCGGWQAPHHTIDLPLVQRTARWALIDFKDPLTFSYFYGPDGDRHLRDFLEEGWRLEETINSLALYRKSGKTGPGLVGEADPSEIEIPLAQTVANLPGLTLRGLTLRRGSRLGCRVVETNIYSQSEDAITGDYLFTARFFPAGGDGFSFGQSFFGPYRILPTSRWEPGEIMVQRCAIMIPREAPPGSYDLAVSFAELSDSGNFKGEIIHIEEGALILSAD
jgi:uncharacterized membrane protein